MLEVLFCCPGSMASLLPLLALLIFSVSSVLGEHQQVILGDTVTFSATGKCAKEKEAKLVYVDQHKTRPVADLQQGVWMPSRYYKDRVTSVNSCVVFDRTVYSDTGLYELTCIKDIIQLDVVFASETSVTEGETVKLPCYYKGEYMEWKRNETLVLGLNCFSGEIRYGTGFKGKVSVSPDGCKQGDFSLTMKEAQLEDEGDYFCKDEQEKNRGTPAAVRLTINPKETSPTCPTLNTTQSLTEEKQTGTGTLIGLTAAFVIVAGLFTGLGWFLKSRHSNDSPRDSDVETPLNSEPAHHVQVNGCPRVNSSHERSTV